jgi:hypothetical protein
VVVAVDLVDGRIKASNHCSKKRLVTRQQKQQQQKAYQNRNKAIETITASYIYHLKSHQ